MHSYSILSVQLPSGNTLKMEHRYVQYPRRSIQELLLECLRSSALFALPLCTISAPNIYIWSSYQFSVYVNNIRSRFSDFAKLNELLKSHHIVLDTSFPPKHWAGRIGSWTPSSTWAPDHYNDLIEFVRHIRCCLDVLLTIVRCLNTLLPLLVSTAQSTVRCKSTFP